MGVGLDESTDRAQEKHVVFIVRYLRGDRIITDYLKIEKIASGTAASIFSTLLDVFEGYNIPLSKASHF